MAIRKLRKLLTVKEVAEYLHCHEQTVYDRVREGTIPHSRVGRSIRFDFSEVIEWHRQDIQPKVINYQPPIVMVGSQSKKEDVKMRKGCSSKPQQGSWNTESGKIFTRVTKTKGVVRYYALYYDADRKLKEKVLEHARNLDEAMVELNDLYDGVFRTKHGIAPKQKRTRLGEFVAENLTDQGLRGKVLEYFGDKWLDDITELSVIAYVRKRKEAGAKTNTINNELIALRKTLYLAKRGRYSIDDQIKWGNCIRPSEFRDRVLNEEEEERLMVELADHLKPIVFCALSTGMRRGEIFSLKWKNIVDGKIVLEARNTKTKKQRRISINSTLQQVFDILKSRNGFSEFVFTYGRDRLKDVHNGFTKACERAEIEDLHFHDLRRTFATRCMQNGFDIFNISQTLGHASVEMTQKYLSWQPGDDADMVESLVRKTPDLMNGLGMEKSEQPQKPLVTSRVSQ